MKRPLALLVLAITAAFTLNACILPPRGGHHYGGGYNGGGYNGGGYYNRGYDRGPRY
ncbi:MAG: hypothetical protein LBV61_04980 [Burkholderiaceae bacterium]|jgi:uncharacterized membrane protein|nr:hypothetical protein [Burkholderiaceae bacterium]